MHDLMEAAREARQLAYVPYSNFAVGAAVLTTDGKIFTGCNIENASYGLCICAERTAIFKAVSAGCMKFTALAVIADTKQPTAPCGACRQVMIEFSIPKIIMSNIVGEVIESSMADLLPYAFTECDIEKG